MRNFKIVLETEKAEKADKEFADGLTKARIDEFERVGQCLSDEASYEREWAIIYGMRLGIRFMAGALNTD